MSEKNAIFYTDGACSGNPGPGGWAYVRLKNDQGYKLELKRGGKLYTTNNEMELTAVYKALVKAYKEGIKRVTIYCDSAYVVNAIVKKWLIRWNENGWKTKEGKNIKNKEIWAKLHKLLYEKNIYLTLRKVKGHSDNILNDIADQEAVRAREEMKNEGM